MRVVVLVQESNRESERLGRVLCFLVCLKVLLWQASVATSPHVFVIATCIRSDLIIYLLVSCNKQFSTQASCARCSRCLYTYRSDRGRQREAHSDTQRQAKEKRTSRDDCETVLQASVENFAYYNFTKR